MKTMKLLALTLLLTIGIGIPACVENSCDGVIFENFFDVQGIQVFALAEYQSHGTGIGIPAGDTVTFSELDRIYTDVEVVWESKPSSNRVYARAKWFGKSQTTSGAVYVDYDVDYIVTSEPRWDWSFSLIPSAYACSYIPGLQGSREEALVDFSIITLNDFDTDHPANANVNDLFTYHGSFAALRGTPVPLTEFISEQNGTLDAEDMVLELEKAPDLNEELRLEVTLELSTGEIYTAELAGIYITP